MNMFGSFVHNTSFFKTCFSLLFQQHHLAFGWMAEFPQNKKCQKFLSKVSNIGTCNTYCYTKANTINFCNIYVVLCLRNIYFYFNHFNKKQNIKICLNLVLCTLLIIFLTIVKWFLSIDKSWIHHLSFCLSEHQVLFHRRVSGLYIPDHLSSPLCMW